MMIFHSYVIVYQRVCSIPISFPAQDPIKNEKFVAIGRAGAKNQTSGDVDLSRGEEMG